MATETGYGTEPKSGEPFIERLAQRLALSARAETVFGPPVERGGVTVIPVAKVRYGFGGGGGSTGSEQGSGGGGGVLVSPVGFIELRDGSAEFRPLRDPAALVPLILAGALAGWVILRGLARLLRA
ncbi:MAG TPA: spore germination protein GerW family protein [Chloroflexota bacterium]|nr:spore germination protein GerW family protein [Chloroflexota bacterium]HZU06749.1 spore germination protein GerW family protein [Chloroflexota bacterium]